MTVKWFELLEAIKNYYGEGDPRYIKVLSGQTEVGEFYKIIKQVPGVTILLNQDGSTRGWEYQNPFLDVKSGTPQLVEANSNTSTGTSVAIKTPINTSKTTDPGTGWEVIDAKQGATAAAGGTAVGGLVKLKKYIGPAILLGMVATKAGLMINPEYWENHTTDPILTNLKDVDPEKYKEITITNDEIAKKYPNQDFFDGMLKQFLDPVTGEEKGEVYVDEEAMAYMLKAMIEAGAFNRTPEHIEGVIDGVQIQEPLIPLWDYSYTWKSGQYTEYTETIIKSSDNVRMAVIDSGGNKRLVAVSSLAGEYIDYDLSYTDPGGGGTVTTVRVRLDPVTVGDDNFYYGLLSYPLNNQLVATSNNQNNIATHFNVDNFLATGIALIKGHLIPAGTGIDGIGVQPDANVPDFRSGMSLSDIIALLDAALPDQANKKIIQQVIQPDGTVKEYTYVPTPMPNPNPNPTDSVDPWDKPVTGDSTQDDTEIEQDTETDPETDPNPIVRYIIEETTEPPEPVKDDAGKGDTPPIVIPTGSASALYSVYNPSEAQIRDFGGWLWSSNFVDQLLKVFSDPMQAIISLHKVFCTPVTGNTVDIKVGYLNSGVQALSVTNQYVTIDCGTVQLDETYRNVFDYPPYTEVSLFLPFIGFVRLDVNDVMRGSINVKYHIDVLTGACLAEVSVIRDLYGGVLYQYSGDCSVHYPLSSGSYMGIVTSLLGIAGTIASGGSLAPMAIGISSGIMSARSSVERSGSISANTGAMGGKKPYFIIQRPQVNTPVNFNKFVGKPSNDIVKIKDCTGFISCTEVHIENCNGTDAELAELKNLLKTGIII